MVNHHFIHVLFDGCIAKSVKGHASRSPSSNEITRHVFAAQKHNVARKCVHCCKSDPCGQREKTVFRHLFRNRRASRLCARARHHCRVWHFLMARPPASVFRKGVGQCCGIQCVSCSQLRGQYSASESRMQLNKYSVRVQASCMLSIIWKDTTGHNPANNRTIQTITMS